MINNLLKLKVQNSASGSNSNAHRNSKDNVFSSMTQDIFSNYKKEIETLEALNKKLTEECAAITRNYEALCKKKAEDQNIIKRGQSELSHGQSKEKPNSLDIKDDTIKAYKNQIDELTKLNSALEIKHKLDINKLIDEIANLKNEKEQALVSLNLLKAKDDNQVNQQCKEIEEGKAKNHKLKDELIKNKAETDKKTKEIKEGLNEKTVLTNDKEMLIKENKLMYTTIEETRDKLNKEMQKNDTLKFQLKSKPNIDAETEKKLELTTQKLNDLIKANELLKEENEFNEGHIKNLYSDIKKMKNIKDYIVICKYESAFTLLKTKKKRKLVKYDLPADSNKIQIELGHSKPKQSHEISIECILSIFPVVHISFYKPKYKVVNTADFYYTPSMIRLTNELLALKTEFKINYENNIELIISTQEEQYEIINKKIASGETKLLKITHNLTKITDIKALIEDYNHSQKEIKYGKESASKEIKKVTAEFNEKITKKRNKKIMGRGEVKNLKKEIENGNASKIDGTEIHKLFNQTSEIITRLKLAIESLQYSIQCKQCGSGDKIIFSLLCGHSLCITCINKSDKQIQCSECNGLCNQNDTKENYTINNGRAKYNYIKLQVDSDGDGVVSTIHKYISP